MAPQVRRKSPEALKKLPRITAHSSLSSKWKLSCRSKKGGSPRGQIFLPPLHIRRSARHPNALSRRRTFENRSSNFSSSSPVPNCTHEFPNPKFFLVCGREISARDLPHTQIGRFVWTAHCRKKHQKRRKTGSSSSFPSSRWLLGKRKGPCRKPPTVGRDPLTRSRPSHVGRSLLNNRPPQIVAK
jgi:hypothetical protein